jgi:bridging integrator 3
MVPCLAAMAAAQSRLAATIEAFYGSADKTSDGAMAGHAYKRSVDDLDGVVGRELVSHLSSPSFLYSIDCSR